ncbi:cytochrome P450 [Aaosphaeria arxii CBS 175.79]|uniref:Cytochrome P450 n=1 Tax=Aaosphaeria arxii CBS 175.79 TaxID=1450172 RepID=A0A6A5XS68_9PLEO|nr:cytochrome P450 [Aaosphaeria arxii CBS 175.79]KAF2015783.1 cytochrome P450 [Aaosphaeria arxii CBS 175.79]
MGLLSSTGIEATPTGVGASLLALLVLSLLARIVYMQYFHPLAKFQGPWYATSFSVVGALISIKKKEPEFFMSLVRKYGSEQPIRISPTMLLFPKPSALKDIYWDPKCNQKSGLYGTGALGPPHLFTTLDGEEHKALRKALSNAPWTIGQLKNTWEPRFDDQVKLFVQKMKEHAAAGRTVCLSDKVAEFAADIMSMISFTKPFGCVQNQRDEKNILSNWRKGLDFFGFVGRFRFFREHIIKLPVVGLWFLPAVSNDSGMGWLMCEADRQVTTRENLIAEKSFEGKPDFMQHALEARYSDGSPLTPMQKRAHVTLLIQAGADTTGTALGSILRFIVTNQKVYQRCREEIETADKAGKLSNPILYEETRQHLPYFVACIKEGLRLNPPATNLFARMVPKEGKVLDGHFIPGNTEVTSHAYVMQRDKELYGADAEEFNPERWLQSEKTNFKYEAAQFTFGVGSRICLGKDVAIMELYKLLPETIRRLDISVKEEGKYVVAGGVAYNEGFLGDFSLRSA